MPSTSWPASVAPSLTRQAFIKLSDPGDERDLDSKPLAGPRRVQGQPRADRIGERSGDRQAQPAALRARVALESREPHEDALPVARRDAGAVVLDRDRRAVAIDQHRNR